MIGTAAVYGPHPIVDLTLGVVLPLHCHIGFDSILVDYLHPRKYPIIGKVTPWVLRLLTLGTMYGLWQFNTNDVGITEGVKRLWTGRVEGREPLKN